MGVLVCVTGMLLSYAHAPEYQTRIAVSGGE
jgi:hypothetical protein